MKAISPLRLVTLPVLALAVLPSCKRSADARMDPEWWRLEADRVELVQEIKLQKMRLGEGDQVRDYAAAKEKVAKNGSLLIELKAEGAALKTEISSLVASIEKLHEAWVTDTRAAAVGRNYTWLEAKSGRRFEDVTITKVSDVGIEFRHATGTARLSATDLNYELHDMFALDSVGAQAAIEQERAAAAAYETWIDNQMVVVNAEKKEEARIAAEREADRAIEVAKARSDAQASSLAANESRRSRLYDAPRAFSSSRGYTTWYPDSYYYYGRSRYYTPAYSYGGVRSNDYVRAFAISPSGGCSFTPVNFPSRSGGATGTSNTHWRANSVTVTPQPRSATFP